MAEKMLMTQALDERDLLVEKINDKIARASFTDTKKNNEERVIGARLDEKEFAKEAESAYQQINDLIVRFQKIDAAILDSNAKTKIKTSYGEFSVASAIALRGRLRGNNIRNTNFENYLRNKMEGEYQTCICIIDNKNKELETTAEGMRLSILGKDSKAKDDKPLAVVDTYIKENTAVVVDPLNVSKKIEDLKLKENTLISELDTQIKVSNATTFVEF